MPRNPSLTQYKEIPFMVSFLKSELGPVKLCLASCNETKYSRFLRKSIPAVLVNEGNYYVRKNGEKTAKLVLKLVLLHNGGKRVV
jgi:hypothetical protein